jgi:hypothetical protein
MPELLSRFDYAIIDRAALCTEPWQDEMPLKPLVPRTLKGDAPKMPALLALKSLTKQQIEILDDNLVEAVKKPAVSFMSCLLIAPGIKTESLIHHLTQRLVLHTPQGDVLLRYYDPKVFPHLRGILSLPQMRSLYGPVQIWAFRFQSEWIERETPLSELSKLYWSATAEQRNKLDNVMLVNETLSLWLMKTGRPWRDVKEYEDALLDVGVALEQAKRDYKLDKESDLSQFALDALAYGGHFHLHPRIQELLRKMQELRLSYISATGSVNETEWAAVAAAR